LKALDPHLEADHRPRDIVEEPPHHYELPPKEDKKDKRPFWDRNPTKERERERDHDRDRTREREKRDEEGQAELSRMIGFLTATASEDWALVLEVCERASANEHNAKEAVKALRREFKYAEPSAQLSAARLWAIMLRNSSNAFVIQSSSRKFLDTIEDVLSSPRTAPVVRERLLDVVGAAAHATVSKNDKEGFRGLWRRVKPADKPDDGVPFDPGDPMFNPPMHRKSRVADQPRPDDPNMLSNTHKLSTRNRVISVEEDIRRLFQECKVGRGNASLLSEALMFAKPEDLKEREIIREFYVRCRASQELIFAQIPWATAGAERSREQQLSIIEKKRTISPNLAGQENTEITTEERLLAALLATNADLLEALRMYDDLKRLLAEPDEWAVSTHRHSNHSSIDSMSFAKPSSTSSSASPSPASSRASSMIEVPPESIPNPAVKGAHPTTLTPGHQQSLAPPPPAPHGPRLLSPNLPRSRSPSPEQPSSLYHGHSPRKNRSIVDTYAVSVSDDEELDVISPPAGLSEKALGKRRLVNNEADRTSPTRDSFFGNDQQEANYSSDSLDADGEDHHRTLWHQPVRYVYDAAAERTQERIKGELSALVKEVH